MACVQILMRHIRATLPDIKMRVNEQQKKSNAELQSLGGMVADNPVRITISLTLVYNLLNFRVEGLVVLSAITEIFFRVQARHRRQ
jgi:hypothetical protein